MIASAVLDSAALCSLKGQYTQEVSCLSTESIQVSKLIKVELNMRDLPNLPPNTTSKSIYHNNSIKVN